MSYDFNAADLHVERKTRLVALGQDVEHRDTSVTANDPPLTVRSLEDLRRLIQALVEFDALKQVSEGLDAVLILESESELIDIVGRIRQVPQPNGDDAGRTNR